jgi:hypothetical protein
MNKVCNRILTLASFAIFAMPALSQTNQLPFVTDNYPKALAEAKQRKLPLFVEVWAPW